MVKLARKVAQLLLEKPIKIVQRPFCAYGNKEQHGMAQNFLEGEKLKSYYP